MTYVTADERIGNIKYISNSQPSGKIRSTETASWSDTSSFLV